MSWHDSSPGAPKARLLKITRRGRIRRKKRRGSKTKTHRRYSCACAMTHLLLPFPPYPSFLCFFPVSLTQLSFLFLPAFLSSHDSVREFDVRLACLDRNSIIRSHIMAFREQTLRSRIDVSAGCARERTRGFLPHFRRIRVTLFTSAVSMVTEMT